MPTNPNSISLATKLFENHPDVHVAVREKADWAPVSSLHPTEAQVVARAVDKRKREFAAGRALARGLLAERGTPVEAIGVGEAREPLFPPHVVGTISHCADLCAAAIGSSATFHGIGIDLEVTGVLEDGVVRLVCLPEERQYLGEVAGWLSESCGARLFFSAKECVHKATFCRTRTTLGFTDVRVTLDGPPAPTGIGTWRAEPVSGAPSAAQEVAHLVGYFAFTEDHVLASAVWPK